MILEVIFVTLRSLNPEMQSFLLLPAIQHLGHCFPSPLPPEAYRSFMQAVTGVGFHEV